MECKDLEASNVGDTWGSRRPRYDLGVGQDQKVPGVTRKKFGDFPVSI